MSRLVYTLDGDLVELSANNKVIEKMTSTTSSTTAAASNTTVSTTNTANITLGNTTSMMTTQVTTETNVTKGNLIRIEKNDISLNLAEVRIFDEKGTIIPYTAKMSSQYQQESKFGPSKLSDKNDNTFAHTNGLPNPSWIELTLDSVREISKIEVVNRKDICCRSRINGAVLTILNDGTEIYSYTFDNSSSLKYDIIINNKNQIKNSSVNGRYINIKNSQNNLKLNDIKVYDKNNQLIPKETIKISNNNTSLDLGDNKDVSRVYIKNEKPFNTINGATLNITNKDNKVVYMYTFDNSGVENYDIYIQQGIWKVYKNPNNEKFVVARNKGMGYECLSKDGVDCLWADDYNSAFNLATTSSELQILYGPWELLRNIDILDLAYATLNNMRQECEANRATLTITNQDLETRNANLTTSNQECEANKNALTLTKQELEMQNVSLNTIKQELEQQKNALADSLAQTESESNNRFYYLIGSGVIILIMIVVIIYLIRKNPEE